MITTGLLSSFAAFPSSVTRLTPEVSTLPVLVPSILAPTRIAATDLTVEAVVTMADLLLRMVLLHTHGPAAPSPGVNGPDPLRGSSLSSSSNLNSLHSSLAMPPNSLSSNPNRSNRFRRSRPRRTQMLQHRLTP